MASGDTLAIFTPYQDEPPSSNYAPLSLRNAHPMLVFADGSTVFSAIFTGVLPRNYAGGGITITLIWSAVPTSNNVIWSTSIERMDTGTDLDSDSFATANDSSAAAAPGTSGAPAYTTIAHTSGAQMDSLAAGEAFRLKVARDPTKASDNMAGDAQLLAVEIKET